MTPEEAKKTVLALASSEVGYQEKASNANLDDKTANAGHNNWTKYARDLDAAISFYNGKKNGYDWCDMFTDWLFLHSFGAALAMEMLCQPQRSAGAGCMYSAGYYQSKGRFFPTPEPGDQIFFFSGGGINHTGIVEAVQGDQVITIEGNSDDCVSRHNYPLGASYIAGYGRPIWEAAEKYTEDYVEPDYEPPESEILVVYGMTGERVRTLQEKLIKLGYSCGPDGADGDFGPNTLKAVVQFQKDHALSIDGEAGSLTLHAIEEALKKQAEGGETPTPTPSTPDSEVFVVNEVVKFKGNKHYTLATGKYSRPCKPGLARITIIHKSANSKHPYHLIKVPGSTSTVFGWVNAEDIEKA